MSSSRRTRLVGLTHRVDEFGDYKERRDGLDQAWVQLLREVDDALMPVGLMNGVADPVAYVSALQLDAVILTGGNDPEMVPEAKNIAPERDLLEWALLDHCAQHTKPVLAVCRGLQVLNLYCGGSLERFDAHVRTTHQLKPARGARSSDLPEMAVNSYHTFGIGESDLAAPLVATLVCDDGTIEACRHKSLPWVGVMWHPERSGCDVNVQREWIRRFFEPV